MDSENQTYCEDKLKNIIEPLFFELTINRPKDIIAFTLDWLNKVGGYTSNGLTYEEKNELQNLRKEIKQLRETYVVKDDHHAESEDESDEEEFEPKLNSRPIGPRIAVSAEVHGKYNNKKDFKPIVHEKSDDQITTIKARIVHSFLFNSLEANDIKIVIDAMEGVKFNHNDHVIEQGGNGDCLYIVEEGELDCYKKFSNGEEKLVKQYFPGDVFGELALLYNCPRGATVIAKNNVFVWKLDRETFNIIVKEAAIKRRQRYEDFLKKVDILSTIDSYELTQIGDALKTASFNQGDFIIREGEMGDVFYIVEEGEAEALKTLEPGKPAQTVKFYRPGEYFGELALIKGEPRAASVIARTNLKVVTLDRGSFKRLLGPIEEILKRNAEKYLKFIK